MSWRRAVSRATNCHSVHLHRVHERIYRSGQPALEDLPRLKQLGVDTVINLRRENAPLRRREREACRALGMRFFSFPFYGIFGADSAFLDAVLEALEDPANGTVLVHCKNGRDRTSLVIGLWRTLRMGASMEQAWAQDFVAFGHDPDRPTGFWSSYLGNYLFRNVRRAFEAHVAQQATVAQGRRAHPPTP